MRRLGDVRLPPLAWVAIAAAVTAALRLVVALLVETPLYYPDEYLNTAISRGFAAGTPGHFRGGSIHATYEFTAYLAPLLQAPAWLLDNADIGYRLAQLPGVAVFAGAGFAAYAMARRLGITTAGAVVVAVLTLLTPAGAFTATLLGEPYAYTLFLVALLVCAEALARDQVWLHAVAIVTAGSLCFVGGVQFVFFGVAYVCAWYLAGSWSPRPLLARTAVLGGGVALAVAALALSGDRATNLVVAELEEYSGYGVGELGSWLAVNGFIVAISAGWVIVPAAVVGLGWLSRSTDRRLRSFGFLASFLLAGMLAEATLWSSSGQGVYERFAFYAAPLLALSFTWMLERATAPPRRVYAGIAYACAFAAALLPVVHPLRGATDDNSPTLMGLALVDPGDGASGLVWASALVLLALGTALAGVHRRHVLAIAALSICALTATLSSLAFVGQSRKPEPPPHVAAPQGATILTWAGTNEFELDKALFWNPEITDVAVLGGVSTVDPFPAIETSFTPAGLRDTDGRPVEPPYVIGPAALGFVGTDPVASRGFAVLDDVPSFLAFGFYRDVGYLGTSGLLFAAADERPAQVVIRLRGNEEPARIAFICGDAFRRTVEVRDRATSVSIPVRPNSVQSCRFGMIAGRVAEVGGHDVSVAARVTVDA